MVMTQVRSESDLGALPIYSDASGLIMRKEISWGGIFAGALFGMMFQVWIAMLGVAIGASTIDPLTEPNPLRGLGVGSGVWIGLTILIASFAGGWVTGRLSGLRNRLDSAVHGAVSWALSNFVMFILVGSVIGGIAGGIGHFAGSAATMASRSNGMTSVSNMVENRAQAALGQARDAVNSGEAQQDARQAGDTAAKAVAGTSFGVVALMFLGLLSGIVGSIVGQPKTRRI